MAAAAIYSVMTGDIHDYKMRVESALRTLGGRTSQRRIRRASGVS
jgi:hypothetical protein